MSESNYLPTGDQQPFAQLCNWQSRGAGCSGRSSGWAPVAVGSPIQCDSAQFRDYPTQSKCLSNCEQSDCAGSRADSGVSMSYNSCTSFDNLSSIPEDSHHLPDISHLRITSEPASVTVSVRVYDEGTSIHDTGSVCKDTVCDSGLGSEVRTSVESTPQPTSVHFSSSANPEYGECERFQQNEDRDTFLHLAIIYGEEAYAEETIKMAVHRESLSIYNNLQQTPLHLAVLTNLPSLVKLLVARGAVVDARDRHGNTPLHIACRNGLLECSVALTTPVEWQYALEAPVFSPHQQIPQDMNIKNYEGETCLHMAATGRHPETIHYLTRYAGADINAKEGKSGRTIIHYLAEQPDADLLLETLRLPGVNVNARTYDGSTPLSLACGRGHANVEAVLLAVGAAMTSADSDSDSDSGDDMMDFNDFQIAGQPISS